MTARHARSEHRQLYRRQGTCRTELDRCQRAGATADLRDQWMIGQRDQAVGQDSFDLTTSLEQRLTLE